MSRGLVVCHLRAGIGKGATASRVVLCDELRSIPYHQQEREGNSPRARARNKTGSVVRTSDTSQTKRKSEVNVRACPAKPASAVRACR